PDLYRSAMRLTRKESDAEDLVQETFFEALKSFHRYEVGTNCKAWLMMIMHNLNLKRHRKIRTMALVDDGEETITGTIPFEPAIPESLTEDGILSAMDKIPDQYRQVVILADVEEYSYKEISSIVGVPVGTVMSRIHRGRKLLRIELAEFAKEFNLGKSSRVAGI
ncbi:MAG: sigma-70 family RNA polymerase sigma factor, partial [Acidobacteriota bacterium]